MLRLRMVYVQKVCASDSVFVLVRNCVWKLSGNNLVPRVVGCGSITDIAAFGDRIAFVSDSEGPSELFLCDGKGTPKRLTFFGTGVRLAGWTSEGLFVSSSYGSYSKSVSVLYKICTETGLHEKVEASNFASKITSEINGKSILQKYGYRYGSWRGYQGGAVGELWRDGSVFLNLVFNVVDPLVHDNRVYFLTDHQGMGNVWSCDTDGADLQIHTDVKDFYVQSFAFFENRLFYVSGGKLFADDEVVQLSEIGFNRHISLENELRDYVSDVDVSDSHSLLLVARGKASRIALSNEVIDGDLYSCGAWLDKNECLLTRFGSSVFHVTDQVKEISNKDIGIIKSIKVSPDKKLALLSTNRHELYMLNIESGQMDSIAAASGNIINAAWSHSGRYIAYTYSPALNSQLIEVMSIESKKFMSPTSFDSWCDTPVFGPGGVVLFTKRVLNVNGLDEDHIYLALMENTQNSPATCLGFAKSGYAVDMWYRAERLEDYSAKEIKLLYCTEKGPVWMQRDLDKKLWTVKCHDWSTAKSDVLAENVMGAKAGKDWSVYVLEGNKFVTAKSGEKVSDENKARAGNGGVWDMPSVRINQEEEWRMIFLQAWMCMKEHFKDGKSSVVDFDLLRTKYGALQPMSREDLNSIIEQMHGELRVSHAYVIDYGDVKVQERVSHVADLGADFELVGDEWVVKKLYGAGLEGPLLRFGDIAGAKLRSIDGVKLTSSVSPAQLLLGKSKVCVEFERDGQLWEGYTKACSAKHGSFLRYKDWVAENRRKVGEYGYGYIHIPDMSESGFKDFCDQYFYCYDKPGLIIDIRNNRGGSFSSEVLSYLIRKRIGFESGKYHHSVPYMSDSPHGPMVLLINQMCASDGDILAAAFRVLKLGSIVGKDTWGGTIGILVPRHRFLDNGCTSQPEFPVYLEGFGFDVENNGVAPDYIVEGEEEQLAKAIEILKAQLAS